MSYLMMMVVMMMVMVMMMMVRTIMMVKIRVFPVGSVLKIHVVLTYALIVHCRVKKEVSDDSHHYMLL